MRSKRAGFYLEKVVEPARENPEGTAKLRNIVRGAGLVLGLVGIVVYAGYSEQSRKNNLAPDAIYVGRNECEDGKACLTNKIDESGKSVSVIRFIGPDGNYRELPIRLDKDGLPEIVYAKK